jgi:hypothetical protein
MLFKTPAMPIKMKKWHLVLFLKDILSTFIRLALSRTSINDPNLLVFKHQFSYF